MLDANTCYEAMKRRDTSFDGVFFVGVRTTGIYCRPVCKARMPLLRNVRFFPSAAAAERAGFRPCLRCRPETAPFCPAWKGTATTVERALRMIEHGDLDRLGVAGIAERLGVGTRHLCRLFAEHLGASPLQVAQTHRLQVAKRLLEGTALPIGDVAVRAGYPSARRLAAATRARYGCSPSELRARGWRAHDRKRP